MSSSFLTRLPDYARLMRLDKPIGIFLLLWPTLWALYIAGEGQPDQTVLVIFVLGVILMRSAGCVINDYADRDIDSHVSRTNNRPLATGRVSTGEAKRRSVESFAPAVMALAYVIHALQAQRPWLKDPKPVEVIGTAGEAIDEPYDHMLGYDSCGYDDGYDDGGSIPTV